MHRVSSRSVAHSGPRRPAPLAWVQALALLCCTLATAAAAQRTDDPAAEMRRWMRDQREEFDAFVTAEDRAFAAFLGQSWQEFELLAGRRRDPAPKPDTAPRAPDPAPEPVPPAEPAPPRPPDEPRPDREPRPHREPRPDRPTTPDRLGTTDITFLGLTWTVPLDDRLRRLPRQAPGPDNAAAAWLALSAASTAPLTDACLGIAAEQQLGHWGLFLLLEQVAEAAYPTDPSRRALLHWYLTVSAGLDTRLAHARPGYVVLYASDGMVYQVDFLARNGRAYYVHDPAGRFAGESRLHSYDGQAPGQGVELQFAFARLPRTSPRPTMRTLRWELAGEDRVIDVPVDQQLVAFLASVPQTDLPSQFGAGLSKPALDALRQGLAPLLDGHGRNGQVAVLLHMVQHAVPYATDDDQFGREDFLYPDESLFYPAADCEDRAALFAVLVRELVGADVVGLDYPHHIAAAVALDDDAPGDRFTHQGTVYTVCDPTYIGAGLGRSMPIEGADSPRIIIPRR